MKYEYDISPEEFELIEQFLNNELTPEQAEAIAEKLQTDEILRKKLEEVKLLALGVNEAILKEKLDNYHNDISPVVSIKKTGRLTSLARRLLVAASILAIICLSGWWFFFRESSYDKIYSEYYKPDPGLITAMGVSDNYTFEKAMVDYKNGDYDKAIKSWLSLKNSTAANDTLDYFLGAAYQADGQYKEAIPYLLKIAAQKENAFNKDACWYVGLALLKTGDKEGAATYIQQSGLPQSHELLNALNKN